MIRRSTRRLRIDTRKPKLTKIKPIDKDIDHSHRVVLADKVVQAFRQKRRLAPVQPLDKSLHQKNLAAAHSEILTRARFYTARVICRSIIASNAPFGKWNTQTFIAGLRCDALVAPWVIEGAINGEAFDTYVTTQLAPLLKPGDVVVWDNLNVHKSPRAADAVRERGAWVLFLPRYSPDLNPIEKAFSKLKTLLRKAKARTYDDLWKAVGNICGLFSPQACWNYFKATGCVAD